MNKSNSLLLSLFFTFFSFSVLASGVETLKMQGEIFLLTEDNKDSRIYVYDGNSIIDSTKSTKSGNFEVELILGSKYTIEVVKEGYVTKRFIVNAQVQDPFKKVPPFGFLCELIPIDKNYVLNSDFPVTIIKMNERKGKFQYNSSYTKNVNRFNEEYQDQISQKFQF